MTREENIEILSMLKDAWAMLDGTPDERKAAGWSANALGVAISALRGPTREQVEKVWSGCPECKQRCGLCVHMGAWDRHGKPYVCEQCVDYSNFESDQRFCEVCGSPMTDEAVDMVMKRLEEMQND